MRKNTCSPTIYDVDTRSLIQNHQRIANRSYRQPDLMKNVDGSVDIYFGPKAPAGKESNWIQTMPGKSWNTILHLYRPLQPRFNKTWWSGELELFK